MLNVYTECICSEVRLSIGQIDRQRIAPQEDLRVPGNETTEMLCGAVQIAERQRVGVGAGRQQRMANDQRRPNAAHDNDGDRRKP
jgi:hypothetical protein